MIFRLLPLAVYIPVGIYLYHVFVRFFTLLHIERKTPASRLLSLLAVAACVRWGWRVYGLGAVIVLHFFPFCLLTELINFFVKKQKKSEKAEKGWDFLYRSSILAVAVIAIIVLYGYFNIRNVRRTVYGVETEKPVQDLTVVQISDLHMGTAMNLEELEKYCGMIQEEEPDVLALTGDIFDESTSGEMMEKAAELLGGIRTTYGCYYVFGNHDYNYYVQEPFYTADDLRRILTGKGIHVLEDETVQAGENLVIAGRQDASVGRMDIGELLENTDQDSFVLLLDHQPRNLQENAEAGMDLQLSGHTHAGQIWPTGQLSALTGITELNYGIRAYGKSHVIVSSGIAGWGYPIRTGGHSEYVVIHIN